MSTSLFSFYFPNVGVLQQRSLPLSFLYTVKLSLNKSVIPGMSTFFIYKALAVHNKYADSQGSHSHGKNLVMESQGKVDRKNEVMEIKKYPEKVMEFLYC